MKVHRGFDGCLIQFDRRGARELWLKARAAARLAGEQTSKIIQKHPPNCTKSPILEWLFYHEERVCFAARNIEAAPPVFYGV